MLRNVEVLVCSCPAQYGFLPCTCRFTIPLNFEPVESHLGIRMDALDLETFRETGVCLDCGCTEEECEC